MIRLLANGQVLSLEPRDSVLNVADARNYGDWILQSFGHHIIPDCRDDLTMSPIASTMHHTKTGEQSGGVKISAVEDAQLGSEMTSCTTVQQPECRKELEMVIDLLLRAVRKDYIWSSAFASTIFLITDSSLAEFTRIPFVAASNPPVALLTSRYFPSQLYITS